MKNHQKYIVIASIVLAMILILSGRGCISNNRDANKTQNEKMEKQNVTTQILNASSTYLVGNWKIDYMDIINYEHDSTTGIPNLDLYKQPSSYTFSHIGGGLTLENEYPVVNTEYNGKKFLLEVDLKIMDVVFDGELIDNDHWQGTLEYIANEDRILSKCAVKATRIR
ncbi:hypothetical protein GC105_16355 [Alkalibaculum sp. M08DMB]|uniref:Uncharacterized protein n=1 Tax=Alkalibaculum sporogenes TaxID=2655001 RepID=A0A6A7KCS9_9FIRM|nr:hypothetical protein [Alkalibaculum sporogenes]MPW27339.1 hypothetical protein [Alkalibaculum sporogenes]